MHQAAMGLHDHGTQNKRVQRNDHLMHQVYPDQMWTSHQEIDYRCFPHSEDLNPVNNGGELKQGHTRRDCGAQVNQEDLADQRHQES